MAVVAQNKWLSNYQSCLHRSTGRDSKIHVFRLSDFEGDPTSPNFEEKIRAKSDLKDHRLERTKGCHLYAISRPGGSHLRMVSEGRLILIKTFLEEKRKGCLYISWPFSINELCPVFEFLQKDELFERKIW